MDLQTPMTPWIYKICPELPGWTLVLRFFSEEGSAVKGILKTPASSGKGGAATIASHHPPFHSAFSVLPTTDTAALSDDDADLFDSNSDLE